MKKKKFIIILAILILIIFFLPKSSTSADDDFTAEFRGELYYKNKICKCIGFDILSPIIHTNARAEYYCFGLPLFCNETCREKIDDNWQDIQCK